MKIFRGGWGTYELIPKFHTYLLMQVTIVAQPATKSRGMIIFGKTEPRRRKKYGKEEWVLGSIGPDCYQQHFRDEGTKYSSTSKGLPFAEDGGIVEAKVGRDIA